ncbi:hypothetical protein JMJ77_0013401, partial [Colletotrichum scovillei]
MRVFVRSEDMHGRKRIETQSRDACKIRARFSLNS